MQPDRAAALAALRWVLGGEPVDLATFWGGFEALPPHLRPLAASHALRHLAGLDTDARQRLLAMERAAAVAYMARHAAVTSMRTALDAANSPAVFLKGIALAEQVYPSPATRTMSDIDVWLRAEDLPMAVSALMEAGLTSPDRHTNPTALSGPDPDAYLEATVAGGVVFIEAHTRPASFRDLGDQEVAALWSSTVPAGPTALPVLSLDAQLLHVCLHTTRAHGCVAGLKSLVDVAMIVRGWPSDALWEAFTARVMRVGAAGAVYVSLELAREELGVGVPGRVLDRLRVPGSRAILDVAADLLWSPPPRLPVGTPRLLGAEGEPGWLRNRLLLRRNLTAEERQQLAPAERPDPRLVIRYFGNRIIALAALLARGELLRPSFWRRVAVHRRGFTWMRELSRIESQRGPP